MLITEDINYRFQGDIQGIESNDIRRDVIELCWRTYVVNEETGEKLPTMLTGITSIKLDDYPQAKESVEKTVYFLIEAQKIEREKEKRKAQTDLESSELVTDPNSLLSSSNSSTTSETASEEG